MPDEAPPDPLEARIAEVLADLLARAEDESVAVKPGQRVSEAGLALLLGYSSAGLKHARWYGRAPRHQRAGRRISYGLADVAAWLVEAEENSW